MKFETLMLRGLFVACLALCALILGAMLTDRRPAMTLAASAALIEAPSVCVSTPARLSTTAAGT
jgi:hypothetical protein